MNTLMAAACGGMLVFGMAMALLGAVLPVVSERVHVQLGQVGTLIAGLDLAMLASMLALGVVMDRYGKKWPLVSGSALVAAGLHVFAAAGDWRMLLVGAMLLGAGGGALNGATNTLVADLHTEPRRKTAALNLLGVFFGFGALLLPFVIGALLEELGLERILYVAAGFSLTLAAAYVALRFPQAKRAQGVPLREVARLARQPLVILFALMLFCQSGNEFTLAGYTATYLGWDLGFPVREASYWLAGYWAVGMAARIIWSRVLLRAKGPPVVMGSALATAAGVVLLAAARSQIAGGLGMLVTGASIAGVYQTVLGQVGSCFEEQSGTVFGILFAVALTGGMAVPWVVGQLAEARGLRSGLLVTAVASLAVCGLQVAVLRRAATERGSR